MIHARFDLDTITHPGYLTIYFHLLGFVSVFVEVAPLLMSLLICALDDHHTLENKESLVFFLVDMKADVMSRTEFHCFEAIVSLPVIDVPVLNSPDLINPFQCQITAYIVQCVLGSFLID